MKLLKMIHTSFVVPMPYTDAVLTLVMHVWDLKSMVLLFLKTEGYGKSSASLVFDRRSVILTLMIFSPSQGGPPWVYLASLLYIH